MVDATPENIEFMNLNLNRVSWKALAFVFATVIQATSAVAADASLMADLKPGQYLKHWLVLGPVPISGREEAPSEAEQKKFFEADSLSAAGGETGATAVDGGQVKINGKDFSWKAFESKADLIDLTVPFGKKEFVGAYAYCEVNSPADTNLFFGTGSDDGIKFWLNDKLVHEKYQGRSAVKDDDLVFVSLKKGRNRLLLKVVNKQGLWGFYCRPMSEESLARKLISAAGSGDIETLALLLKQGIDVDYKTEAGLTALHVARMSGAKAAEELLKSKGADSSIPMPSMEAQLDAYFKKAVKEASPAIAVLAAKDGKILYRKAFGYANVQHKVLATIKTRFRIGSVTKQFAAAAILHLQDQGKLSVKDTLDKFYPDYPRGKEVTLHHLLTHTSGIHSYTANPDFLEMAPVNIKPEDLIKIFKNAPFDFPPGEKWHYSNSGYFLLGEIVGKVSGISFRQYLKKNFFGPLDMHDTDIYEAKEIIPNEAYGYGVENGELANALNWDMSRAGGAGALYSTVEDLYKWNEGFFGGKLLKSETLKAALVPVKLNNGEEHSEILGGGYAYGFRTADFRGLKSVGHGGGLHGFLSQLSRYPEENFTVAVLVNAMPPPPELTPADVAQRVSTTFLWEKLKPLPSYRTDH